MNYDLFWSSFIDEMDKISMKITFKNGGGDNATLDDGSNKGATIKKPAGSSGPKPASGAPVASGPNPGAPATRNPAPPPQAAPNPPTTQAAPSPMPMTAFPPTFAQRPGMMGR